MATPLAKAKRNSDNIEAHDNYHDSREARVLSPRDTEIFLEMLETEKEPNEAMLNAVSEYRKIILK